MFCEKCGKELTSEHKFCDNCGAEVTSETTPPNRLRQQFQTGDKSKTTTCDFHEKRAEIEALLGEQAPYYLDAFEKIQTTGKDQFNWTSLLLSLPHAAYRNRWENWIHYMKYPFLLYILNIGFNFLAWQGLVYELFLMASFCGICSFVWFAGAQILHAKEFNTYYMHYVDEILCGKVSAEKITDYPRAFIATGVAFVVILVLNLLQMGGI